MKTFMKFCFRILWWATFVVLALLVIALAYRDWIAGQLAERKIRDLTGLEAEIGNVSFSLAEPKFTFNNFKLYNTPEFGGALLLDIPELHVEYDRSALRHHQVHITFMRVNVNELDVVRNGEGRTNLYSLAGVLTAPKPNGGGVGFAPLNGYGFSGIDSLNLSISAVKFIDLQNPKRDRTLTLHLQNQVFSNVKSPADLAGFQSQLWALGGYLVGLPQGPQKRAALPIPAGALKGP